VLGCWVAELLFLMWYVVVAREIETKEDRKERERERERERREKLFLIIKFSDQNPFFLFPVIMKTDCTRQIQIYRPVFPSSFGNLRDG